MKFSITSSVLASLIPIVLVIAVPLPVNPGDVVAVKPKDYVTDPAVRDASSKTLRHQAVVLSGPDANGHIKVAQTSSSLSATDYAHQGTASDYHTGFSAGHAINTGHPDVVHQDHALLSQKITTPVSAEHLAHLKTTINNNCGAGLTRRDGSCAYTPKNHGTPKGHDAAAHGGKVVGPAKKVGGMRVVTKKRPAVHAQKAAVAPKNHPGHK